MSDEIVSAEAQWIQCSTCARHVRAQESGCPFCARDSRSIAPAIAPAAAVIAALIALAPADSLAERRAGGAQRGAQSSLQVQAYGAPAPAYGLAPPVVPSPRTAPSITAIVTALNAVNTDNRSARINVSRSLDAVRTCADSVLPPARPGARAPSANVAVDVRLSNNAAPRIMLRSTPRLPALETCIQNAVRSITWAQPTEASATIRWTYRVDRRAVPRQ